jgi:hypothetical protein
MVPLEVSVSEMLEESESYGRVVRLAVTWVDPFPDDTETSRAGLAVWVDPLRVRG